MNTQTKQVDDLVFLNDELENYFRNTIIPQLFVDANLILRKFTPPAMKQFSLSPADVGKPMADIKDNFRVPEVVEDILLVIASGELLEKEIQTTDFRWYQMNILPYIVAKTNKTNGVIITFVDITTRIKDLEDQEKLIIEHEMLLDTIAHDLKNPITALNLSVQMLKRLSEKGMERFPELITNVEKSLSSMQYFINELSKSRWQKHRYQAVEEPLCMESVIEEVRLTLAPQIEESNAVVKVEIGATDLVFVRRKLRSLIYNLVNNGIKYRSPDRVPEILIKTEEEQGFMRISVSDNGVGIPESDFENIFSKYHRLTDAEEGTGIGLYLVKEIVDSSCGRITVESELGKGSTFKTYLKLG